MAALVLTEEEVRALVREEIARALGEFAGPGLPLDTAGAAREASVSPKTIRAWVAEGRLRATRRGRSLRIERADLARAMAGDDPDPRAAADAAVRALHR